MYNIKGIVYLIFSVFKEKWQRISVSNNWFESMNESSIYQQSSTFYIVHSAMNEHWVNLTQNVFIIRCFQYIQCSMINARPWFGIYVNCERKMPFNADKHTQSTENCNGKYFIQSNIPNCCRFPMVSVFRIRMELGTKPKI